MNFKRLRGIAAAAFATLAAAMLAGCMNPMAGSVDGNSNARMATLQLSATGIPEEYAKEFAAYCERQNTSARSILPDNPFEVNDPTLKLVLTGKSTTGNILTPEVVELDTTNTTTDADGKTVYDFDGTVTLDSMNWNLCLTAYTAYTTEGAATNKAVLVGYCSVDLRNGSGTAKFVMGIAGLDTPGEVNLGGTIVDKKDVAVCYTMGIYRKDNLQDVGGTEKDGSLTGNNGADETFTYSVSDVPPGTYFYIMKFYKDTAKKNIVGSFTDTIVINPGNALSKTDLVIDVIQKLPTEPENLKAYLVDGKESSDGETYNVKLTWEQAAYLTNYELNVVEYDETSGDDIITYFTPDSDPELKGLIKNGKIYGMASMDDAATKTVTDFPGSAVFGTDSSYMMYGDTSCVLKLETGKLYEVQLRARNYVGVSKWVNRIAGGTEAGCTAYKAPADQRINRLLITYNLNSGKLVMGTTNSYNGMYAEYKSFGEETTPNLLAIDTSDAPPSNANKIDKSGAKFAEWQLEDGTAVNADGDETTTRGEKVTQYTYKNATVKASYGNELTGAISQEDKMKDVLRSDIIVGYTLGTGSTIDQDDIDKDGEKYVVSKMTGDKANTVTITLKKVGSDYTNPKFEAWTTDFSKKYPLTTSDVASGLQCDILLTSVEETVLNVMVTADTKNGKGLSQTLTFDLQ